MKKLALTLITVAALAGCARTPSNVYVLSTEDCGAKWTQLNTSQVVPKHTGNVCGYNVALPNWPMAGDTEFKTQFRKGVLSVAKISYSYSITNPIKFIDEARYLGKMGGSLEISAENVGARYEMAENIIIDKLLREVTTDITREIDVVDNNPAELEELVMKKTQETLAKRGVAITDIALVIENSDLTRMAIDAATAVRVYEAAGIRETGVKMLEARAGATSISVNQSGVKQ